MGTIRGFGSIIVDGLRVTYAPDVPIQTDGQPRTVSGLEVGQVVRVIAEKRNGVLVTGQIDVTGEALARLKRRVARHSGCSARLSPWGAKCQSSARASDEK